MYFNSSVTNQYSTTSSSGGISGLVSGMDTDSMVDDMTAATRAKIARELQQKQLLSWEQEAIWGITSLMGDFSSNYLSFSSTTNLLSEGFFSANTVTAKGSNMESVTASGNSTVLNNFSISKVSQLASNTTYNSPTSVTPGNIVFEGLNFSTEGKTVSAIAGKSLTLTYANSDYTLTLDSDLAADASVQDVVDSINEAISKSDLEGRVAFTVGADNKVTITDTDESGTTMKIDGGSTAVLNALGFTVGQSSNSSGELTGDVIDETAFTKQLTFADTIAGSTLTFDFNGVKKDITFPSDSVESFDTQEKFVAFLQKELNSSFGAGKLHVAEDGGDVNISLGSGHEYSQFSISSKSADVMGENGILGAVNYGSNRLDVNRTIEDLGLIASGTDKMTINVNGTDFEFDKDKTVTQIMNEINSSDAGVRMDYISTTNKFMITATDSGSVGQIEIKAGEGATTFMTELFDGDISSSATREVGGEMVPIEGMTLGRDANLTVNFGDGDVDIVRSTNAFSLDGLNLSLHNTFDSTVADGGDEISFDQKPNTDVIGDAIVKMVEDFNEIISKVNTEASTKQNRDYAPLTAEQKEEMSESEIEAWEEKAKAGMLFGDSDIRALSSDLRFIFSNSAMENLGITVSDSYGDYGKLSIDATKLKSAIETDPDAVKSAFAGTDGVMNEVKTVVDRYAATTGTKGIFVSRAGQKDSLTAIESTLYKSMAEIDTRVAEWQEKLAVEVDRYTSQFAEFEQYLAQMNQQSSWLMSQFSSTGY